MGFHVLDILKQPNPWRSLWPLWSASDNEAVKAEFLSGPTDVKDS